MVSVYHHTDQITVPAAYPNTALYLWPDGRNRPLCSAHGETPPENDFTLEKALDLILRLNAEAGGDSGVDPAPNRVAAMSGLCKMKSVKTTDESTGVSVRAMAADPAQPVKGKEKGIWLIELAQYLARRAGD